MDAQPLHITAFTDKAIARFWSYVNKTDTCWLWIGSLTRKGYGNAWFAPFLYRAHRVAYYFATGLDPFPNDVLHSCDVNNCVNPSHLFTGTNIDNIRDKQAKGRQAHLIGSQCPSAALDEESVRRIKQYLAQG